MLWEQHIQEGRLQSGQTGETSRLCDWQEAVEVLHASSLGSSAILFAYASDWIGGDTGLDRCLKGKEIPAHTSKMAN